MMQTGQVSRPPNFGDDRGQVSNRCLAHNGGIESGAEQPLVDKRLANVQLTPLVKQGHFGAGAGAARRAVHMTFA